MINPEKGGLSFTVVAGLAVAGSIIVGLLLVQVALLVPLFHEMN